MSREFNCNRFRPCWLPFWLIGAQRIKVIRFLTIIKSKRRVGDNLATVTIWRQRQFGRHFYREFRAETNTRCYLPLDWLLQIVKLVPAFKAIFVSTSDTFGHGEKLAPGIGSGIHPGKRNEKTGKTEVAGFGRLSIRFLYVAIALLIARRHITRMYPIAKERL